MKNFAVCLLVLSLWGLSSCTKETIVSSPSTGLISGLVTDTGGVPVSHALISSSPPSSQLFSDSLGKYELDALTPGEYIVSASKQGIGNGSADVNVNAGQTTTAIIILSPIPPTTGIIAGKVVDSSGKGISGVSISTTPTTTQVTTDVGGGFSLIGLTPGIYSVTAWKTGFDSSSASAVVQVGKTTTVSLSLATIGSIPVNGLVAYYPLNGDGTDHSGYGFDLTMPAGSVFFDSRLPGRQSWFCGGSATKASASNNSSVNSSELTLSIWVRFGRMAFSSGQVMEVVTKYQSTTFNGFTLHFTDGNFEWLYGHDLNNFSFCLATSAGIVLDSTWHSVICTADHNGTKMFIDGVLNTSGAWTGKASAPAQTNGVSIGFIPISGLKESYSISDVLIYNRVLSDQEIKLLANMK